MKKLLCLLITLLLLVGCGTLYTSIITVTSVVDSAMKSWAHASNQHLTTPEFDAKVVNAHNQYRKAAAVAQGLLKTYKATGNAQDRVSAIEAARDGALPLVDLIASILSPAKGVELKTNLMKASTL